MITCTNCRAPYPSDATPHQCPRCSGIYDLDSFPEYRLDQVRQDFPGIWRFQHALGLPDGAPIVTLGEGRTPLICGEAFGRKVAFKLEYLNPSGSYKDRGSAVLVSFLKSRDISSVVEDSSGNAGASLAAYIARMGMQASIYMPESTSQPKVRQIEAYGASVVRVPGPRSHTTDAVLQAVAGGAIYASHANLPQVLSGYATLAYEIYEQIDQAPGTLILPAGQGNLLLGLGRGFLSLQRAGLISNFPWLVGVQARACAPLWAVYHYGAAGMGWVSEGDTLAEGVRVKHPRRGDAVIKMLIENHGTLVAVDEDEIINGRIALAHQGFYVEYTSAIVWSALQQIHESAPDPIVVILTGSGLKN